MNEYGWECFTMLCSFFRLPFFFIQLYSNQIQTMFFSPSAHLHSERGNQTQEEWTKRKKNSFALINTTQLHSFIDFFPFFFSSVLLVHFYAISFICQKWKVWLWKFFGSCSCSTLALLFVVTPLCQLSLSFSFVSLFFIFLFFQNRKKKQENFSPSSYSLRTKGANNPVSCLGRSNFASVGRSIENEPSKEIDAKWVREKSIKYMRALPFESNHILSAQNLYAL